MHYILYHFSLSWSLHIPSFNFGLYNYFCAISEYIISRYSWSIYWSSRKQKVNEKCCLARVAFMVGLWIYDNIDVMGWLYLSVTKQSSYNRYLVICDLRCFCDILTFFYLYIHFTCQHLGYYSKQRDIYLDDVGAFCYW